jgi:hypothetical protein
MWMEKEFVTKAWQEHNKIMTKYVLKIVVEQTKSNVRF